MKSALFLSEDDSLFTFTVGFDNEVDDANGYWYWTCSDEWLDIDFNDYTNMEWYPDESDSQSEYQEEYVSGNVMDTGSHDRDNFHGLTDTTEYFQDYEEGSASDNYGPYDSHGPLKPVDGNEYLQDGSDTYDYYNIISYRSGR